MRYKGAQTGEQCFPRDKDAGYCRKVWHSDKHIPRWFSPRVTSFNKNDGLWKTRRQNAKAIVGKLDASRGSSYDMLHAEHSTVISSWSDWPVRHCVSRSPVEVWKTYTVQLGEIEIAIRATDKLKRGEGSILLKFRITFFSRGEFNFTNVLHLRKLGKLVISSKWTRYGVP